MSTVLMAEEISGRRYDRDEERVLIDELQRIEDQTVSYPVEDPRQILLDGTFRTMDGACRLSWLAVRQACRELAAGLGTYVTDLAGYRRAPAPEEQEFYSQQDAADAFNAAVRRRFGRKMSGMQAIRNVSTNVIEALVGHGYRRLPNRDFVERVQEIMASVTEPWRFHEGVVVGRRLMLVYLITAPDHESGDDRMLAAHHGFCFTNSEVGDGAVRATPLVWFDPSGLALMSYNNASRVAHTGRDFPRRLQRLLDRVIDRWRTNPLAETGVGQALEAMRERSLGFSGHDEDADDRRFTELMQQLRQKQLTQTTARRILRRALFSAGRDEAPLDLQRAARRATWGGRSIVDLFVSVLREAQDSFLHITGRERLEQLAYQMLVGRFRPEQAQPR